MDPRDRLRDSLAGVGCTACGASVPADRIRILAERDDLTFVEFRCAGCGSEALGLVVLSGDDGEPVTDVARYGEFGADDEARLTGPALDVDDVRRMRTFLDGWQGALRTLVDPDRRLDAGGGAGPAGGG